MVDVVAADGFGVVASLSVAPGDVISRSVRTAISRIRNSGSVIAPATVRLSSLKQSS
jgi:hypothetical protein